MFEYTRSKCQKEFIHVHVHVRVCIWRGRNRQRKVLLLWICEHAPSALIRWLTSVQSGTQKMGPSNWPSVSSPETANKPPRSIDPALRGNTRCSSKQSKRWVRGMKGLGCLENKQWKEFCNWFATYKRIWHASCLLITPRFYTRRLLCYRVPGTICWLLCEKIGRTRVGHFPPNYPHLVVLLQAAWTGKRGKKDEKETEGTELSISHQDILSTRNCGNLNMSFFVCAAAVILRVKLA